MAAAADAEPWSATSGMLSSGEPFVTVRRRQAQTNKRKHFVFVLDKSGSMGAANYCAGYYNFTDTPWYKVRTATQEFLREIQGHAEFDIITFNHGATRVTLHELSLVGAEGGTNFQEALLAATDVITTKAQRFQSVVVMMTDGVDQAHIRDAAKRVPLRPVLENIVWPTFNQHQVQFVALGFSAQHDIRKLAMMCEGFNGGVYSYAPDSATLARFIREFSQVNTNNYTVDANGDTYRITLDDNTDVFFPQELPETVRIHDGKINRDLNVTHTEERASALFEAKFLIHKLRVSAANPENVDLAKLEQLKANALGIFAMPFDRSNRPKRKELTLLLEEFFATHAELLAGLRNRATADGQARLLQIRAGARRSRGLQAKSDARTVANAPRVQNLLEEMREEAIKIAAGISEEEQEEDGNITCALTVSNWKELVGDPEGDVMGVTFEAGRHQCSVENPNQLTVGRNFQPMSWQRFREVFDMQQASGMSPEDLLGRFNRQAGTIYKGERGIIRPFNAWFPLFCEPEHWRAARLLLGPAVGIALGANIADFKTSAAGKVTMKAPSVIASILLFQATANATCDTDRQLVQEIRRTCQAMHYPQSQEWITAIVNGTLTLSDLDNVNVLLGIGLAHDNIRNQIRQNAHAVLAEVMRQRFRVKSETVGDTRKRVYDFLQVVRPLCPELMERLRNEIGQFRRGKAFDEAKALHVPVPIRAPTGAIGGVEEYTRHIQHTLKIMRDFFGLGEMTDAQMAAFVTWAISTSRRNDVPCTIAHDALENPEVFMDGIAKALWVQRRDETIAQLSQEVTLARSRGAVDQCIITSDIELFRELVVPDRQHLFGARNFSKFLRKIRHLEPGRLHMPMEKLDVLMGMGWNQSGQHGPSHRNMNAFHKHRDAAL